MIVKVILKVTNIKQFISETQQYSPIASRYTVRYDRWKNAKFASDTVGKAALVIKYKIMQTTDKIQNACKKNDIAGS